MKRLWLLLLIIATQAHGQDAEILHIFDSTRADIQDEFLFVEEPVNINLLTHVALVQVSSDRSTGLEIVYTFARRQASELGANCYRVAEFEHQENGLRVILDLYYADESVKKIIRENQPHNIVHVFGSDVPEKTYSCKVNNRKIELPPFTFYRKENKTGQETKVSKGGLTGMAVWVTWAPDKPARYITLSGFGLSGAGVGPGVGAGFNTGRLAYLEPEVGRFLSVVMTPVTLE